MQLVFYTYNSSDQFHITTWAKYVLPMFLNSHFGGFGCFWDPIKSLKYVRCHKFDVKLKRNQHIIKLLYTIPCWDR